MRDRMGSFLHELRGNVAGNTLAIAAAALVPVVGMVGGAVDISRYYMATARMQNACDAGALAARKQMESDAWTTEDEEIGLRFFDQNYPDGTFGLENLDRTYTADAEGTVTGTATGEMPTTIMQIFGKEGMDIAVSCSAEINISNTDIMFVLDVTGSMGWRPNGSSTCSTCSDSRIAGLRTAVVNFYDAVEDATSDAAQIRYGVVPYASNVNVGGLLPAQYIASEAEYQSRRPVWRTDTWWDLVSTQLIEYSNPGPETNSGRTVLGTSERKTETWCNNKLPPPQYDASYVGPLSDAEIVDERVNGTVRIREIDGRGGMQRATPYTDWDASYTYNTGWPWYSNVTVPSQCEWGYQVKRFDADVSLTTLEEWRENDVFEQWSFEQRTFDVTPLKTGGVGSSVGLDTGWSKPNGIAKANTFENHRWNGCIEEADTVATGTWDPLPNDAYDLNINLVPSNDAEAWKPWLPSAVFRRYTGSSTKTTSIVTSSNARDNWKMTNGAMYSAECPRTAMALNPELTRAQLVTYLSAAQGFQPNGYTYHDIGMIWGARLISPRGIFQAANESAPNGDTIARHIVFMTDGELDTEPEDIYNAYGIEWWDRRVTSNGTESQADARHAARFQAACRQAREENISVWVVAFGTALTQNLVNCATPGRAYHAASSEQLNSAFQEIAQKIAALRLTS